MSNMQLTSQPTFRATRFDLRPLRRSDVGLSGLYAADKRIARMTTSIPHPLPPGATEAFLDRALAPDRTEDVWALDASRHGGAELFGLISLTRMDRDQSEIGYWVAPQFWGGGMAHEAVAALLDANPQNNQTVFGSVFQDNPASARVLTNSGFEYIGDAEAFSVARAANVPTWTYIRKMG